MSLLPAMAVAQGAPATITGRVVSEAGQPLGSASVLIEGMGIGGLTRETGEYSLLVPAARVNGQQVTLTARIVGYKLQSVPITLRSGMIEQNFTLKVNPLQLGEVVITGAGTVTAVEKLGSVRNNVTAEEITKSNEPNVVQALAGKAPNVEVTQSSGEPGASSFIRMRGQRTVLGGSQPLFVVDGSPVDNSSFSTSNFNPLDELGTGEISGTTQMNRAVDINPDDIESIEILKGPAAAAIYGARAGQGVVLITTKRGRAGQTRYSLRSSYSFDDVAKTYPLQRSFGQGNNNTLPFPCDPDKAACFRSWGPRLTKANYIAGLTSASCNAACAEGKFNDLFPNGLQTYDHANEAYDTGHVMENTFSTSGGNERTTFYFSASRLDNQGVFKGPNNSFDRTTVRLNASHQLRENLKLGANMSYADTRGDFVQRGNNVNGLQLGLLRTPPEFNNLPYLDPETHLHRSFRLPHPSVADVSRNRGFDNPFFVLNEPTNQSRVGRFFGNINAEYFATSWLKVNYTLGGDYSNDERLEGAPQASSDVSQGGRITEGSVVNFQLDHNLTATANWTVSPKVAGTFTLGQNLNVNNTRQLSVVGRVLVGPQPYKLQNTVARDLPIDNEQNIHQEGYFGQGTVDLWEQLYLTAALRNDGFSTFGSNNNRAWYPKGSAAWNFTNYLGRAGRFMTYGKVRAAYGEAGTPPGAYLTDIFFTGSQILGGISQGTGEQTTRGGFGGLITGPQFANPDLKPERTKETEAGVDLGLFGDKADFGLTFYNAQTNDVILVAPLPPSSGFSQQAQNAATFRNRGLELTLNIRPLTRPNYAWDIGFQWANNKSKVLSLNASDFVAFNGTSITPFNVVKEGEAVGVFYDFGWVRCGVSPGDTPVSNGTSTVALSEVCSGKPKGALYIAPSGFPIGDSERRIIGDPNPDWTGSVRTGFRFKKWQFSGLLDIKQGGDIYNGTLGALRSYGTAGETAARAICATEGGVQVCHGNEHVFGRGGWYDGPTAGPGSGKSVPIGQNWWRNSTASDNCAFSGISEPCIEDGSYMKLRELSVAYSLDLPFVRRSLGLSSVDIRVAGRNLKTWTDYKGYDPETNLGGAIQATRGMDYFNMPQTRSFVFSVGLNR